MLKKALMALACAATLAAPAAHAAVDNLGFESGTTSWTVVGNGTLQATDSATVGWTATLADGTTCNCSSTITPIDGSYFGLYVPDESTAAYSTGADSTRVDSVPSALINFASTGITGGYLYARMITSDWSFLNDSFTVTYLDGAGATLSTATVFSANQTSPDSGWYSFAVPNGAAAATVSITDQFDSINNAPILALDYSTSAVPEPTSIAMMLAGLGALGFKRRRQSKAD